MESLKDLLRDLQLCVAKEVLLLSCSSALVGQQFRRHFSAGFMHVNLSGGVWWGLKLLNVSPFLQVMFVIFQHLSRVKSY